MKALGIILIVVGLLTIALPYVTFTKKEKVLDIGPIEAVKTEKQSIPISPIIGLVVMVGGVAVLVAANKK